MLAAGLANGKFVKYLLEMGCDFNAVDQFGWTALHHACTAVGQQKKKKNKGQLLNGTSPVEIESTEISIIFEKS